MKTPNSCSCAVCKALRGLSEADVLKLDKLNVVTLPPEVIDVLAAQGRIIMGEATAGDVQKVIDAASRCSAGRFQDYIH